MIDYSTKVVSVGVTSAGLLLGLILSENVGGAAAAKSLPPRTPQYLIEARLYQEDASVAKQGATDARANSIRPRGGAHNDSRGKDESDVEKKARLLASPRLLANEKQRAIVHLGDSVGMLNETIVGNATVITPEFTPIGTAFTVQVENADNGKLRVAFTLEQTTGQREKAVNVVVTDGIRVHGAVNMEPDKTVKVCDFASANSKRLWMELTVHPWLH